MSANSYSALLRRSKLATFSPAIEQVYTPGSAAQLKRQDFGFKHTLPLATTSKAPFVRVTRLDNAQRRTDYRKATREALYVRKWAELDVAITPEPLGDVELQSRFVPDDMLGSIKPVEAAKEAASASMRVPNFFTMAPEEFERFLDSLGDLRPEFAQFAANNLAATTGSVPEVIDLYELAQADPAQVTRLVEQFLARQTAHEANDKIIPCTHPKLGLQYSTPTRIDDALAPLVPGRILAEKTGNQKYSTVILGQIDSVAQSDSGGKESTQFMPDMNGERSNQPGRAMFRVTPKIEFERISRELNTPPRSSSLRESHEPRMLAARVVGMQGKVERRPPAPLPGTREKSLNPGSSQFLVLGAIPSMLKAKAKAAATAAKKRAAELAAQQARQEQAEQYVQRVPNSTLTARRSAANVTQFWGDAQSSTPAPGGGLLKIGYDQAAFERAAIEVLYEPKTQQEWAREVERRRKAARGESDDAETENKEDSGETKAETNGTGESQTQPTVAVNKEHLAYILKHLEVPDREAKAALRKYDNDLALALRDLTGPVQPVVRSGAEPSRLVKI
ncbi:hypothetical protein OIV83_001894 [Microbotryomycetes sp. JL201]|nr:hypothetical protein OIV83_001894 [Microbotryomycetes sp. JL201]